MKPRPSRTADQVTAADLVVLVLLAEKPTHGYDLVAELQRREVGDPPEVSRAQVYYSLKKLLRLKLILTAGNRGASAGPEREPYRLSAAGRRAMSAALSRRQWARERPPIPFHTWLMLIAQGNPTDRAAVLNERRAFLDEQIEKQTRALEELRRESGPGQAVSVAVLAHELEISRLERQLLEAVEPMLGSIRP